MSKQISKLPTKALPTKFYSENCEFLLRFSCCFLVKMIIKIVPAHFLWNNLHLVDGKITLILSVVYDNIKLDESSFPCGVFLKISCVWGHLRTEREYRKRKMRIFENNFLIDSKENTRRMFHSHWRSPNFFLIGFKNRQT